MTDAEAREILGVLLAAYRPVDWPASSHALYVEGLRDLEVGQAVAVVKAKVYAGEWEHMPRIADLRRAVTTAVDPIPGVEVAFAEVLALIRQRGYTRPPAAGDWSHPAIAAAVDAIGWSALCQSENIGIERAHFLKLYGSATSRAAERAAIPAELAATVEALAERLDVRSLPPA